ncbi:hypothetical protein AOX59_05200 [Lentibacillus amyloliquefaciens]|uniref:Uncharacterized protein n=1 Tax=Lentibacillus amyloliquefaciens TaxID=1472767 RepID=A0A0U4DRT5_9BACI|nr:hypothetical protein AOX59_05200 [Lentibacillus amyloliquefaciens]
MRDKPRRKVLFDYLGMLSGDAAQNCSAFEWAHHEPPRSQRTLFEEAEAVPMESGFYCRSVFKYLTVIRRQNFHYVAVFINCEIKEQQNLRKEPNR